MGDPDPAFISTSYAERQHLTIRMAMRCFTRQTSAFSKTVENLQHAVTLHFMYYNFARINKTLWVTPAMEWGSVGTSGRSKNSWIWYHNSDQP